MALIDKIISELKLSREIVDVYRDRISASSLTGIIANFSEDFICLSLLSDEGESDGVAIVYRQNITRIRSGGNVRQSIKELSEHRETELQLPDIDLFSIDTVLSSVQAAYGYVNVHTEYMDDEVCFIGALVEQDDEWVTMEGFGTIGGRDSHKFFLDKEEISRVDAGAKYEESVSFIHDKIQS